MMRSPLPRAVWAPVKTFKGRVVQRSDLNARAVAVFDLIVHEPWFTFFTDHDDGLERSELQLALCEMAKVVRPGGSIGPDYLAYAEQEDALDAAAAATSAAISSNEECRANGHDFAKPWSFNDICTRCGCVRLRRGNPSRFVYLDGS